MNEQIKNRINAVRCEIEKSGLAGEHRDILHNLMDHAEKCANGTPDKINALCEAVSDMLIRDVRNEIRSYDRMKELLENTVGSAINDHAESCSFKRRTGLWGVVDAFAQQYPTITIVIIVYLVQTGRIESILKLTGW